MKQYIVKQSFHFGELSCDLVKDSILFFDKDAGKVKFGNVEQNVRPSPLVGAIKRGWLVAMEDLSESADSRIDYEGVEESRPIEGVKKSEAKTKKKEFEQIVYEEDSKAVDESKQKKTKDSKKPKIGFEDREDEDHSIQFEQLKNMSNVDDADLIKSWDLNQHWATRKKEMLKIKNVNTLMRLAVIDKTLKKHIDKHISSLSPKEKNPSAKKETKPEDILGQDFDTYVDKNLKEGKVEVSKIPPNKKK